MPQVKYIRTKDNQIVVFSCLINHSRFRALEPISAGFIRINTDKDGQVYCRCYGESITLDLKANEVEDTELARTQILGYDY